MIPQCVFLAGGRGTRLGALTRTVPKPMLPVASKPFIRHLVERVASQGCRDILVLAGYLGEQMLAEFCSEIKETAPRFRVVVEPSEMGTAGALRHSADLLDEQFILLNADTFFDIELTEISGPLPPSNDGPGLGRLALRAMEHTGRFGVVERTGTRITRFAPASAVSRAGEINCGVYYLDRKLLSVIGPGDRSLECDVFPRLVEMGALHGVTLQADFIDIGVPEDYDRAQWLITGAMSHGRAVHRGSGSGRPAPMIGAGAAPANGLGT